MTPLDVFALAVVVLFLKMLSVAWLQGAVRTKHDQFVRPEDAEAYGSGEVAEEDVALADRAQRALRNDVENIPIFLFLAWCGLEFGVWEAGMVAYLGVFVGARVLHTITYLKALQPYRTLAYAVGNFMSLAVAGHVVVAVFG